MSKDLFGRRARIIARPHDADTVKIETDSGYGGREEHDLRLLGCWMPELRDPGGHQMRQVLVDWFAAAPALTWPLWVDPVQTTVREPGQRMTFARYLCVVWHFDGRDIVGAPLNEVLNAHLAGHPEWGHGAGA